MWANSPSFCLSSSETLSTAKSHPISWKSAQQLRNTVKLVVQKCYLAQQCSSASSKEDSTICCYPWKLQTLKSWVMSISDSKYCILVIPCPTFMKHFNFDAKAKLSVKGSMTVTYWDGLVMRMDTHLDQTWNQSVVLHSEQISIHVPFFLLSAQRSRGNSFSRRSKALLSQSVYTEMCEHCDSLCAFTFLKELGWISPLKENLPLWTSIPPSVWSTFTVYRKLRTQIQELAWITSMGFGCCGGSR